MFGLLSRSGGPAPEQTTSLVATEPTPSPRGARGDVPETAWLDPYRGSAGRQLGSLWKRPQPGEVPVRLERCAPGDRGAVWFIPPAPDTSLGCLGTVYHIPRPNGIPVRVEVTGPAYERPARGAGKAVEA